MGSKTSPSYARFLNALLLLATAVLLLLGYVGALTWMGVAVSSGVLLLVVIVLGYAQVLAWVGMTGKLDDSKRRTLWDWMQMLIVPAVLALGALWLAAEQEKRQALEAHRQEVRQQRMDERREEAARLLDERRAQDAMLLSYLDQMSALLIDKEMKESEPGEPERLVAGARTITVMRALDPERKRTVLRFVYEAGLIHDDETIVDLASANLAEADLNHALLKKADLSDLYLTDANLVGADLSGADLSNTNLSGAVLTDAELDGADLTGSNLSGTELSGADLEDAKVTKDQLEACGVLAMATMPDGSRHAHGGRRGW